MSKKARTDEWPPTSGAIKGNDGDDEKYVPPKVWKFEDTPEAKNLGNIAGNRPTAGSRFEKKVPVGKHPFQLYSMGTPNGQKVAIMLEELLQAGKNGAEYDAWMINIIKGDQFGSGFVDINPNSKVPALVDYSDDKENPKKIFESGSILIYLAEKFDGMFFPCSKKTEILSWLFWQAAGGSLIGGGFGHFYALSKEKIKYPIDRFTMETKRQLDVLERQLATNEYVTGNEYTIADIAIWTWHAGLVLDLMHVYGESATFLNVKKDYPNVTRWGEKVAARPAVQRGSIVNKVWGAKQLAERHDAKDIDRALTTENDKQS